MRFTHCIRLNVLLVTAALAGGGAWAQVRVAPADSQAEIAVEAKGAPAPETAEEQAQEPASLHPREVYPQIVRLSLVEGDVRVAVGKVKGEPGVAPWVKAVGNMPLETGFSVVTGKGRAEIEFEDASTMYVGENSVLTFDTLTTRDNVPETEMTLIAGVADLNLHPSVPKEEYLLETPTDFVRVRYGQYATLRINSYMDTATTTPLMYSANQVDDPMVKLGLIGKTFTFNTGRFVPAVDPRQKEDAAFDGWVIERVKARAAAMHAVMQEAGLSEPLPGLADMQSKGTFFECKPYGTCWLPNKGWAPPAAGGRLVAVSAKVPAEGQAAQGQEAQGQDEVQQAPTAEQQAQNAKLAREAERDEEQAEQQTAGPMGGGVAPALWTEVEDVFPCSPYSEVNLMGLDPVTGQVDVLDSDVVWNDELYDGYSFDWAVCHAGSWIYWHHRYAWVAGRRRHHRCPVRWVKANGRRGYVPVHPHDRNGKEPGNLRHGIFMETARKDGGATGRGGGVERVAYSPGMQVKLLGEAPREFREPVLPALRASGAPTLEAHSLRGGLPGSRAIAPTSLIAFDSRARGFTVTTQMNEGGHSRTVVDHFGGGIARSSGSFGGGGGAGHFGGGGGGHFGGGGSGGGGGFHGGGGTSSASVSSSSSAGAGASGGGHAH